jgi:hypothetical protein
MPPKGESIGYALEDAVMFSTVFSHYGLNSSPEQIFTFYEKIRRNPIEDAYKSAAFGWNTNRDSGWLTMKFMEWITPIFLWWTRSAREKDFSTDPRNITFPA